MLILCLLLILFAVIAFSYYQTREYFENLLPTIGNTVKCVKNAPAGTTSDTLFQLAKNNKLNKYTDLNAALEWDPIKANQPKIIDDCKAYTLGTEMKAPGPGTTYGMTVNCATNPPGDKPADTYFQYSADQVLNWYPDKDTADEYWGKRATDIRTNDTFLINDCSGFSLGNLMGSTLNPSSTTVGRASGPNDSYGTENTPDAQIGKDGNYNTMDPMLKQNIPYDQCNTLRINNLPLPPACTNTPDSNTGNTLDSISESDPDLSDIDIKNWIKQLQPLLPASNLAQSAQSLSAPAQPIRNDVNPQVSVSDTGYNAMELQNQSSLLSNIKKIVKDELRTNRIKSENHPLALSGKDESCSNSTQQGSEYMNGKEDMSKYIKKDAIPCWGCTLDY